MNNKNRNQLRMSNLLEKSKHINFEQLEDKTAVNYVVFLAAILDTEPKTNIRYYTKGLEDNEEGDRRMHEIDELRKRGELTECEKIVMKGKLDKYHNHVLKEVEKCKRTKRYGIKTKVTNKYAGTVETFDSLKDACEEYGLKHKNLISNFKYKKSSKIKYHGLIIEKLY